MLLVVTALREESRPIATALGLRWEPQAGACRLARRGPVALLETGPGPVRAAKATTMALERLPQAELVLALGFAGGLDPDLAPAALVLGHPTQNLIDGRVATDVPPESLNADPQLLSTLAPLVHQIGPLATLPRVLTTRQEKLDAHSRWRAVAVDMETAAVGAAAVAMGRRFAGVRAITDPALDSLPLDFNQFLDAEGRIHRGRIVRACLARPSRLSGLIRLGRRSAAASRTLADFAAKAVQALGL